MATCGESFGLPLQLAFVLRPEHACVLHAAPPGTVHVVGARTTLTVGGKGGSKRSAGRPIAGAPAVALHLVCTQPGGEAVVVADSGGGDGPVAPLVAVLAMEGGAGGAGTRRSAARQPGHKLGPVLSVSLNTAASCSHVLLPPRRQRRDGHACAAPNTHRPISTHSGGRW